MTTFGTPSRLPPTACTSSAHAAGCNTTLYIYDYCNMGNFDDTNEGSIYYDDNQGGCGEEASLTILLEGGVQYWVRWSLA